MKKILAVVAIALALSVGATQANAAMTATELQAEIARLTALIAQISGGSTASAGYQFNTNLTVGSTGADVVALQDWLSAKGYLSIPAGTSKGYFGQLTKTAVAAYQASAGLPATGFVGPQTRAKLNASASVSTPSTPTTPTTPVGLTGGEGQLTEVDNTSSDIESSLKEGEEDVKVFGAEFDAEDSDVMVERVDVDFTLDDDSTTESDNLEDYITEVSLFWGDKKLATLDVDEADVNDGDSSDDLTDDDNDVYSFRFTGLNAVVKENDTAELYVAVSAVNNIDSTDTTGDWKVIIPDDGIRAVDAAGISETYVTGSELTEESFSVEGADAGNLDLTLDSGDNEDRVVQVNADTDTNNIEILKFSLESDTSDNNVDQIQIDLATTTATTTSLSTVVKRLKLYADGKEVGSESVSNGTTGGASATFENLDIDINEDEEVVFVVKADFNDEADKREGYEFEATVDASEIDAEDSEGDSVTVTGDVTGGDIELRTTGVSVAFVSSSEDKTFAADASGEQDIGTYKVVFKVTAFEEDVYLDRTVTRDDATAGGSAGDGFMWATTSDSTVGTTSLSATVSAKDSSGSDTSTKYKISKGETREFTLSVDLDASDIDGTAAVMLTAVNWTTNSGDSTPDYFYTANLDDFKTDNLSLYTF